MADRHEVGVLNNALFPAINRVEEQVTEHVPPGMGKIPESLKSCTPGARTMPRTLEVVFDGKVFRPDTPPDLRPSTRYTISVHEEIPVAPGGESAWDVIERLIGTVEGPEDWAAEHDHYLYGTPKNVAEGSPPS